MLRCLVNGFNHQQGVCHWQGSAENDYPTFYPYPAFSAKAIVSLGDLLTSNGEFLPLAGALPGVMLFHVQSKCRLLDLDRSDVEFLDVS